MMYFSDSEVEEGGGGRHIKRGRGGERKRDMIRSVLSYADDTSIWLENILMQHDCSETANSLEELPYSFPHITWEPRWEIHKQIWNDIYEQSQWKGRNDSRRKETTDSPWCDLTMEILLTTYKRQGGVCVTIYMILSNIFGKVMIMMRLVGCSQHYWPTWWKKKMSSGIGIPSVSTM